MRDIDNLLRMELTQRTTDTDYSKTIEILTARLGCDTITIPAGTPELRAYHRAHVKTFKKMIREEMKTGELRIQHQEDLISQYIAEGNHKQAKILRRMQRAEAMERVWMKCRVARGLKKGGLSHIEVPTNPNDNPRTCTDWTTVDDQAEMVDHIQSHLGKHFAQSANRTLTTPPLDVTMKFSATCEMANSMLQGRFDTSQLNNPALEWIVDNWTYVEGMKGVDYKMTVEDFKGKLKSWPERTSTSPISNIHLGHGKAYIAHHDVPPPDPDDPDATDLQAELESWRDEAIRGHLVLINYCLHFGYSLKRWRNIVNAMLEKEPGNPKLHRSTCMNGTTT